MEEKLLKLAREMARVADSTAKDITGAIDVTAQKKLSKLIVELTKLTGKGGKFSANIKTLRSAVEIIRGIDDLRTDPQLQKAMKKYNVSFAELATLNNSYVNTAFEIATKSALAEDVTASALALVEATLSKEALNYTLGSSIISTVKQTILSKGTIGELEDNLMQLMFGNEGNGGIIDANVSRIARDSVFQYNRDYLNAISAGIDIEYYLYAGSEIKSSRPFCKDRNDEVWSKEEVISWNKLDWQGKKEGNIFSNVGGYNCRHRLLPYPAELVEKK